MGWRSALRVGGGRLRAQGRSLSIDASRLETRLRTELKAVPSASELVGMFGRIFSDHMLVCDWEKEEGWGPPRLEAFGNLELSPASMSLHYALQCFEGMKAYRTASGEISLFRPELNAARLNSSLRRLAMPTIDEASFVELLKALVRTESRWVPADDGCSAYLRPTVIATDPQLNVNVARQCKFFVVLCPVGPYFLDGFKPIQVFADEVNVRAWRGGSGNAKLGANYGPTIKPQQTAAQSFDAQQVLYCPDGRVTEVGAMNFFAVVGDQLWTPPLARGDILPGVTRRSILELAPDFGLEPLELDFTLDDLRRAHADGRLTEAFGAGTAAIVCPISVILHADPEAHIRLPTGAGPVATQLFNKISDIHYGRDPAYAHWNSYVG